MLNDNVHNTQKYSFTSREWVGKVKKKTYFVIFCQRIDELHFNQRLQLK